jgi:hypothetical protein
MLEAGIATTQMPQLERIYATQHLIFAQSPSQVKPGTAANPKFFYKYPIQQNFTYKSRTIGKIALDEKF